MTTPAPQQQPSSQQQDQGQNGAALIALAALLGASAVTPTNPLSLVATITHAGVTPLAASLAVQLRSSSFHGTGTVKQAVTAASTGNSTATSQAVLEENAWRARYLLAAALRIQRDIDGGVTATQALDAEQRWADAHDQAARARVDAAARVDVARNAYGLVLGWYLGDRQQHTADCIAATGTNFRADTKPRIGWPGSVHMRCGCKPGAAHLTRMTVDQATEPYWQQTRRLA